MLLKLLNLFIFFNIPILSSFDLLAAVNLILLVLIKMLNSLY
jgi:hypothetical protein